MRTSSSLTVPWQNPDSASAQPLSRLARRPPRHRQKPSAACSPARSRARTQVLIESSGISEPLPVAETFTFRDQGTGVALNDVARLHNLVTVVDAASIFEQLGTMDTLVDRGWHDVAGDKRTVAHLLCDQLEFANLLLLNKCDLPYT